MFNRLRNLVLVGVGVVVVAAFFVVRSTAQPLAAPGVSAEETSTVDRGDITLSISATSSLQANQSATLAFALTGRVSSINVNEGDYVRKGQVIATVDNQTYQDAVLLAQANVDAKQIALNKLTAKPRDVDIAVAKAVLNLAQAQLTSSQGGPDQLTVASDQMNIELAKNALWAAQTQRDASNKLKKQLQGEENSKNPLVAGQAAAEAASLPSDHQNNQMIDPTQYNVQIAQSQLNADQTQSGNIANIGAAQAKIVAAQIDLNNLIKGPKQEDIDQAQSQLDGATAALVQAQRVLAKSTLVAPFDGVVAKLNLHLGEAPAQGPAVVMLDTSSFYVDVAIDERDISRVSVGQDAILTFDSLPGTTVDAKVTKVATTAAKNGDVVTYLVRAEFTPKNVALLSSMSTTVSITTDDIKNALRVRNRFIRLDRVQNKAYVSVRQADGSYKDIEVVLGLRNDTFSEIKSGVNEGDTIAILPQSLRPVG